MSFSWLLSKPLEHPIRALLTISLLWKSLLLLLATCSPGLGYDTSTTLLSPIAGADGRHHSLLSLILSHVSEKLTRWDAIYFTTAARRNYVYEQEWAFGWGLTRLVRAIATALKFYGLEDNQFLESIIGITIAHVSHLLSVIVLYSLVRAIFPASSSKKLAFVTACLHIFSPAGLFLSGPCPESPFALLHLFGCLLFVRSISVKENTTFSQDLLLLLSGLVLGISTTIRSNGLLSGIILLEEAFRGLYSLKDGLQFSTIRRLAVTGIAGISMGLLFLLPQYIAYMEYCGNPVTANGQPPRIWCGRTFPSIYAFVQAHYWDVGFLRYWTLSNIPLFLIATPMLIILSWSSLWTLNNTSIEAVKVSQNAVTGDKAASIEDIRITRLLRTLALPQFVLAVLALTSYHVQIITRLSSGYAIWYIWLAATIISHAENPPSTQLVAGRGKAGSGIRILKYMLMYALVQGGLFASFLPPA